MLGYNLRDPQGVRGAAASTHEAELGCRRATILGCAGSGAAAVLVIVFAAATDTDTVAAAAAAVVSIGTISSSSIETHAVRPSPSCMDVIRRAC